MNKQTIVLGGGCFWCTEAVYQRVQGVTAVMPGYAGGDKSKRINYYWVATGKTGHAEVIKVEYDADIISLETLLDIFWVIHDPTTKDRQGADVGSEYRSIVLYTTDEQRQIIEHSILKTQDMFEDPIVTEVQKLDMFFEAELDHHDFYNRYKNSAGYCRVVIDPKLQKFMKHFGDIAKEM